MLCEEWEKTRPRILKSETVYNRLTAEGESIPEGAMDDSSRV